MCKRCLGVTNIAGKIKENGLNELKEIDNDEIVKKIGGTRVERGRAE